MTKPAAKMQSQSAATQPDSAKTLQLMPLKCINAGPPSSAGYRYSNGLPGAWPDITERAT
jgi:hypothetical protein